MMSRKFVTAAVSLLVVAVIAALTFAPLVEAQGGYPGPATNTPVGWYPSPTRTRTNTPAGPTNTPVCTGACTPTPTRTNTPGPQPTNTPIWWVYFDYLPFIGK